MGFAESLGAAAPRAVGSLSLDRFVMLAPMSGVSDLAMRRLARRFGAALAFSEMVAAESFLGGDSEAAVRAEGEGVAPHAVQLVGREAPALAQAARRVEGAGADIVDLNMGCPARRVAGQLCGAALMRDLDAAERLISAVVDAVCVPVTVKMRLGWDASSINAPDLARRAEAAGARMMTVHGRTRAQFYEGRADWGAVGAVVEAVSIPVIVNGDCGSLDDARDMLAQSGARGIMVGRAALGRPWLAGAIGQALASGGAISEPSRAARRGAAVEHLEWLLARFGAHAGLRHARKHLAAYAEHAGAPTALRRELVTTERAEHALALLEAAFDDSDTLPPASVSLRAAA